MHYASNINDLRMIHDNKSILFRTQRETSHIEKKQIFALVNSLDPNTEQYKYRRYHFVANTKTLNNGTHKPINVSMLRMRIEYQLKLLRSGSLTQSHDRCRELVEECLCVYLCCFFFCMYVGGMGAKPSNET